MENHRILARWFDRNPVLRDSILTFRLSAIRDYAQDFEPDLDTNGGKLQCLFSHGKASASSFSWQGANISGIPFSPISMEAEYAGLAKVIRDLASAYHRRRYLVAIARVPGSGKSTTAEAILQYLRTVLSPRTRPLYRWTDSICPEPL